MHIDSKSEGLRTNTRLASIKLLIILLNIIFLSTVPFSNLVRYKAPENQESAGASLRTGITRPVSAGQILPPCATPRRIA
jgi:hypothetical protein